MIIFEKKYRNHFLGGLFSGLLVGGILGLITGYIWLNFLFIILGVQQGIIFAQKEKLKDGKTKTN